MNNFSIFTKIICSFITITCLLTHSVYSDDIDNTKQDNINDILATAVTLDHEPSINSRAYVVLDRNSNTVLLGKNETQKRKMASTTKIMTATIIIENFNLSETITISKKAASVGGSTLGLKENDKITIKDLLYGLMLRSGNDAAIALAEYAGGNIQGFANLMNTKASELGLINTHFETPHGLDSDNHYTTAYELALLSNYAMKNKTFANIVNTKTCSITINGNPKTITNTNELLGNLNGVYGIKTGFTNGANRCLVSCCKRGNLDVICVVLGADTKNFRTKDSIKLLEYTFQNFEPTNIEEIANNEFIKWKSNNIISINKGISDTVSVNMEKFENNIIPLHKDKKQNISIDIKCTTNLTAPVKDGYAIGEIILKVNDQIIGKSSIVTTKSVQKKSIFNYFIEFLKNFSIYTNELCK